MQVLGLGCGGKSMIYRGHEDFREWRGDCDTPVVFWVLGISFSFIQRDYLGCSPRGRWCLGDGTIVKECG